MKESILFPLRTVPTFWLLLVAIFLVKFDVVQAQSLVTTPVLDFGFDKFDNDTTSFDSTGKVQIRCKTRDGDLIRCRSSLAHADGPSSVYLEGAGQRLVTSNNMLLSLSGPFTVSLYVRILKAGYTILIVKRTSSLINYQLAIRNSACGITVLSGSGETKLPNSSLLCDGQFHHVAMRQAGTSVDVFVDGAKQIPFSSVGDHTPVTNNGKFRAAVNLNGYFDRLRLYNDALSDEEIKCQAGTVVSTSPTCFQTESCTGAQCPKDAVSASPPKTMYGFGWAYQSNFISGQPFNQPFFDDVTDQYKKDLVNAMAETGNTWFRYPAGTPANFWDWDTGQDSRTIRPYNIFTLENLASYVNATSQQRAIFVVNVVLENEPDLAVKTAAVIKQLTDAEAATGVTPLLIELGNELYSASPKYDLWRDTFPTGTDYVTEMAVIIAAIKNRFPGAKVAWPAVAGTSRNVRKMKWNQAVVSTAAALPGADPFDAATLHFYTTAGLSSETKSSDRGWGSAQQQNEMYYRMKTDEGQRRMLYEPWRRCALGFATAALPADYDIWVTEFSLGDGGIATARGTWGSTLYMFNFVAAFLADGRSTLVMPFELNRGFIAENSKHKGTQFSGLLVNKAKLAADNQNLNCEVGALAYQGYFMKLLHMVSSPGAMTITAEVLKFSTAIAELTHPEFSEPSSLPAILAFEFIGDGGAAKTLVINNDPGQSYHIRVQGPSLVLDFSAPFHRYLCRFNSVLSVGTAAFSGVLKIEPHHAYVVHGSIKK